MAEAKVMSTENSILSGEVKVLPQDDVTVYATDKAKPYYKVGDPIVAHRVQAAKLVEDGKATETKQEPKKDK